MKAKQATPHEQLMAELMDSNVPKSEREHAAAREIEKLRAEIPPPVLQDILNDAQACENGHFYFANSKENECPYCKLETWSLRSKATAKERLELVQENKDLEKLNKKLKEQLDFDEICDIVYRSQIENKHEVEIHCSSEQLRLIQFALEFYSRIGILQLEEILRHVAIDKFLLDKTTTNKNLEIGIQCMQGKIVKIDGSQIHCEGHWDGNKEIRIFHKDEITVSPDWSEYHAIQDEVKSLLIAIKNLVSKMPLGNGSYGIYSQDVDESCRTAFDMMQIIRHEFWKMNKNALRYTVDSHVHLTGPNHNFKVFVKAR